MTTKKVGSTGKFGARYGVSIKKRVLKVNQSMKEQFNCPFCGFSRIKREAAGLFLCKKCGAKFTGGAYTPETLVGKTIRKVVSQRSFMTDAAELIKLKEGSLAEMELEVSKALNEDSSEEKPVKSKKTSTKEKRKKEKAEKAQSEAEAAENKIEEPSAEEVSDEAMAESSGAE